MKNSLLAALFSLRPCSFGPHGHTHLRFLEQENALQRPRLGRELGPSRLLGRRYCRPLVCQPKQDHASQMERRKRLCVALKGEYLGIAVLH